MISPKLVALAVELSSTARKPAAIAKRRARIGGADVALMTNSLRSSAGAGQHQIASASLLPLRIAVITPPAPEVATRCHARPVLRYWRSTAMSHAGAPTA